MLNRCKWVNLQNKEYINYHDNIWGKETHDDEDLFSKLSLEIFQTGLSFETIYNKSNTIKKAFKNFNIKEVSKFGENEINALLNNDGIIKNRQKINAIIENAKVILKLQKKYNSFANYIWQFKDQDDLINKVYKSMKQEGFKHIGPVVTKSFLETIGMINGHEPDCFLYKKTS